MLALDDQGPPPAPPAAFNLAAHVLGRAAQIPDKLALSILGPAPSDDWTYGRLEAAVRGLATGLLRRGLEPGDRVLLRLGNEVAFPVAYLAAICAGLIPVPTSSQLTRREITRMAAAITPSLIIAGPGIALPDGDVPVLGLDALDALQALPPADYALGDPDRPAYIIYTSGTSGHATPVLHAHRAIWARQMMYDGWYGLRRDDRLFHAGAFNWTYTLGTGLMDPWAMGATALIPARGVTSGDLPDLMARAETSIFAAAPGVYRQMLRAPFAPMPALRHGLSAGEKLPGAVRDHWRATTGCEIFEAFGMSECSTFISGAPARPAPNGALGYAQTGRRVAVLPADDGAQPVERGAPGVLAVARRDPGLMLGYWGEPEASEARYRGEWFITGDQVSMDEDGAIRYLGRADDMMNAGGFRVSPLEVEAVFNAHPQIAECAAVELTVKDNTTAICLYYSALTPLAEAVLSDFAAEYLARYKQPRRYVHIDALPRNANGKLQRSRLRVTS